MKIFSLYPMYLKLGSLRNDDIHPLGQRNLIAPAVSPKIRRQSIPANYTHSMLGSSLLIKSQFLFKLSTGDINNVIIVSSKGWP